jgi:hypothetical protein
LGTPRVKSVKEEATMEPRDHRLVALVAFAAASTFGCGSEATPDKSSDPTCGGETAAVDAGTGAPGASGSGDQPAGGASSIDRVWKVAPSPPGSLPTPDMPVTCPEFEGETPGPPAGTCVAADRACVGCPLPTEGLSFARAAVSIFDDGGATKPEVRTEPGAACVAGTSAGFTALMLQVHHREELLDVAALGITQVEFTIDSPPTIGVEPLIMIPPQAPSSGRLALFNQGVRVSIVSTQTLRVSLEDFQEPNVVPDTSRLVAIGFFIGAVSAYDFCVRDLKFFDANDHEVLPR